MAFDFASNNCTYTFVTYPEFLTAYLSMWCDWTVKRVEWYSVISSVVQGRAVRDDKE